MAVSKGAYQHRKAHNRLDHSHVVPVRQRPSASTFMGTMRLHWRLSMLEPSSTRTGVPFGSDPAVLNIWVGCRGGSRQSIDGSALVPRTVACPFVYPSLVLLSLYLS